MVHSGVFVGRQYAAFAGITHRATGLRLPPETHGPAVRDSEELGATGRTKIFRVHHKPLYAAISEPDNRNRRRVRFDRLPGRRVLEEESEHLLVRADLLIQVQRSIASRRLKQAEVAKVLRVTQPRVSDLLRGRIDLFSTDALIDMLARLGVVVRLTVRPGRPKRVA